MLKLRSMMEGVAEKLFGRFLPLIEVKASCSGWQLDGCCGWYEQSRLRRWCPQNPPGEEWEEICTGHCAV
jgi:hypothetical protein